ncbi:hypothetical protein F2Q70_00013395 [Brassica cretica]|uniref:Uncharacterized protein n=1 Tax=Brassica cretica TaxID=69181 RepID=A0A8S9PA05_BRACR|nr:hypothetical protein F2Q70_00013395 [Brassica cretica]KAF3512946.1 hypothetical protein F2Q69_00009481 [Brassica cretica]
MFTPPSKCPPSFSATLIGSVNSMSFKAPIIIASPGGLLGTESGRVSCLRSELHPQTEARYSPCVNAYHVGDFYESPRYLIRYNVSRIRHHRGPYMMLSFFTPLHV